MIGWIINKELKEIIGSRKFPASFLVCSLLIFLTFYAGIQNYKANVSKYEASIAGNLRKFDGLTDWNSVDNFRVYLPPRPLEALVGGISNDIGRTINVDREYMAPAQDSRFGEDPVFAVFRFLDLEFIFVVILSLFAVLFAYDAVCGEKEKGTLRLVFSNPVPKYKYLLGKWIGYLTAICVPLLIPVLLSCMMIPVAGIDMTGDEWVRLAMIIMAGMLYFSAFLGLAIMVSVMTRRSSSSFLIMLVAWIFLVLIVPRTSVILAGRAVDVPGVDDVTSRISRFRSQVFQEDTKKIDSFRSTEKGDMGKMLAEFNGFMGDLQKKREARIREFTSRMYEERANRQRRQSRIAFGLASISPAAVFSLAASELAGTSITMKERFAGEAMDFRDEYRKFREEKTGQAGGGVVVRISTGQEEQEEPNIDPGELPKFTYSPASLMVSIKSAVLDGCLLVLFNIIFFAAAFAAFLKYDVR